MKKIKFILVSTTNIKGIAMKKIFIFTILGCISLSYGQRLPYPFLYHVTSKCNVIYNSDKELYGYSYVITNDAGNNGTIFVISLDISRGPNTITYDTIGLTFASEFTEYSFRNHYPILMNKIVPVGFPILPNRNEGWFGDIGGVYLEAYINTDSLGITPGETDSNIVITSKALPGVRKIRFEPNFWDDYYFQYDDTTNTDDIDSIRHVINFYGNTIGPSAPPINFISTVWCDTLTCYTTQSRSLGFIAYL